MGPAIYDEKKGRTNGKHPRKSPKRTLNHKVKIGQKWLGKCAVVVDVTSCKSYRAVLVVNKRNVTNSLKHTLNYGIS